MNFKGQGKGPICKIYSEVDKSINLPIYLDEGDYNNNEGMIEFMRYYLRRALKHNTDEYLKTVLICISSMSNIYSFLQLFNWREIIKFFLYH